MDGWMLEWGAMQGKDSRPNIFGIITLGKSGRKEVCTQAMNIY